MSNSELKIKRNNEVSVEIEIPQQAEFYKITCSIQDDQGGEKTVDLDLEVK